MCLRAGGPTQQHHGQHAVEYAGSSVSRNAWRDRRRQARAVSAGTIAPKSQYSWRWQPALRVQPEHLDGFTVEARIFNDDVPTPDTHRRDTGGSRFKKWGDESPHERLEQTVHASNMLVLMFMFM